jgi:predicted nucleic acid-binding protein
MGMKYLIDTNVIIDYTSNLLNKEGFEFIENIFNTDFNISVIVEIEALGYNEEVSKMQLLEKFLALANVIPLDKTVTKKTIELRKSRKLKLGDAIIAATALVYDLTIITRNTSDFKNVDGIIVIDLYSLEK